MGCWGGNFRAATRDGSYRWLIKGDHAGGHMSASDLSLDEKTDVDRWM